MVYGLFLEDGIVLDSMLELSFFEGMFILEGFFGFGFLSQEQCVVFKLLDEIFEGFGILEVVVVFLIFGVSFDYSFEEIDEKEEFSEVFKDLVGSIFVKLFDIVLVLIDMRIIVEKDFDLVFGISDGEIFLSFKGKI